MPRPTRCIVLLLVSYVFTNAGCGGGSNNAPPPPPPQSDFAIAFSANSVNVPQGGTSSPITVSISAQNGFSASVNVSLTGVPAGITTNPASPFSLSPGQNASVLFGATLNSGPARVTATSAQTVFVSLSGEGNPTGACNNCLGQMNLLASPPSFQPAPQPEVTSLTGAPLLQADAAGETVYLAYDSSPGGPIGAWSAANPNAFSISTADNTATDLSTSADGTLFALRSRNTTGIRASDLTLVATPAAAEVETVPNRVAVPGVTLHPSGALLYEPFLDGPAPAAPTATGVHAGIHIGDPHNGQLRLRLYLPEPFAMLNTDGDGLHGGFLTVDENGQRLFAVTTSGLTVVQLARVPLGIGTLNPAAGPASGGTSVTLRGSGFQSRIMATLGGKSCTVSLKDMNMLTLTTPAMSAGPQQLVLTNPDGESVSLDAAFLAQSQAD